MTPATRTSWMGQYLPLFVVLASLAGLGWFLFQDDWKQECRCRSVVDNADQYVMTRMIAVGIREAQLEVLECKQRLLARHMVVLNDDLSVKEYPEVYWKGISCTTGNDE